MADISWIIEITENDILESGTDPNYDFFYNGSFSRLIWGDGAATTEDTKSIYAHGYTAPGTYTITLTSNDEDALLRLGENHGKNVKAILHMPWVNPRTYENCINLISVPPITKSIGLNRVCYNCPSLQAIQINCNTTGKEMFAGCSSLKEVIILNFKDITTNDFSGCTNLENITLNCTSIQQSAFEDCKKIKNIKILGATEIPPAEFKNCELLEQVNISGQVICHSEAFANCGNLTAFYADKIILAGQEVFSNCEKIQKINAKEIILNGDGVYNRIFYNNKKLTTLPAFSIQDTSDSMFFDASFQNCIELKYIPLDVPVGEYKLLDFSNTYSGCFNIKDEVNIDLYQNRTDTELLIGNNCFFGCFSISNYNNINDDWGGGYLISGDDSVSLAGRKNKVLSLQLDTTLAYRGEELELTYKAENLPDGFSISSDGIISGISTSIVIGAYYVDVTYNDLLIKNIRINFRITDTDSVIVDEGTIGYKLGNKFIKIVV